MGFRQKETFSLHNGEICWTFVNFFRSKFEIVTPEEPLGCSEPWTHLFLWLVQFQLESFSLQQNLAILQFSVISQF